jgi:hypothetical protein
MPISPVTLTPNLVGPFKAFGLNGPSSLQLAQGLAQAFTQFLVTIPVTTAHVGVVGAGTGTGKVTIDPVSGVGLVTSSLASVGIVGPSAAGLAAGVVQALAVEINTNALVQVVIAGSSTGAGTGTLAAASAAAFVPLLVSNFTSVALSGVSAAQLAQGLGLGIATWLKTAFVTTVDVGTPVFPFATVPGVGTGKVF